MHAILCTTYICTCTCICIPRLDLLEGLGYVGEVIFDAVTLVTYHQVRPRDTQCSLDLCGEVVCVFDVHVQWTASVRFGPSQLS